MREENTENRDFCIKVKKAASQCKTAFYYSVFVLILRY